MEAQRIKRVYLLLRQDPTWCFATFEELVVASNLLYEDSETLFHFLPAGWNLAVSTFLFENSAFGHPFLKRLFGSTIRLDRDFIFLFAFLSLGQGFCLAALGIWGRSFSRFLLDGGIRLLFLDGRLFLFSFHGFHFHFASLFCFVGQRY